MSCLIATYYIMVFPLLSKKKEWMWGQGSRGEVAGRLEGEKGRRENCNWVGENLLSTKFLISNTKP